MTILGRRPHRRRDRQVLRLRGYGDAPAADLRHPRQVRPLVDPRERGNPDGRPSGRPFFSHHLHPSGGSPDAQVIHAQRRPAQPSRSRRPLTPSSPSACGSATRPRWVRPTRSTGRP
ncbi:MAG: hypothetical protein MZU95_05305 [Desulfomicrobium escambiense]|nr:hypothetical protein [Desulfomicrobium escambiense]